jgi:hypothetical protein
MILTGENRGTPIKSCPRAKLPTTNTTWIALGLNPRLQYRKPVSNRLSYDLHTPLMKAGGRGGKATYVYP